jgi:glycosyltransferase involved in cell wall biosynthesis
MRYVVIVPACDAGGISSYCGNLASELLRRGENVLLVLWQDRSSPYSLKPKEYLSNLPHIHVQFDSLDKAVTISKTLSPQLALRDGDILLSHAFPWISDIVVHERKNKRIVHIEFIHQDAVEFYTHANRVTNTCDMYVSMSNRITEKLRNNIQLLSSRHIPIILCPGGISIPDKPKHRQHEIYRICYVGRLDPIDKRVYDLVLLTQLLMQRNVRFFLTVIGGGEIKSDLEERFAAVGASDYVTLTGMLARNEVDSYLPAQHVLVMPSAREGFPMAMCEAMAHGVVPIVTRVSGAEDVIRDGVNGFLVSVGDMDAMSEQICLLACNKGIWANMSDNALQTAREELTIQSRLDVFLCAVKELCNHGNKVFSRSEMVERNYRFLDKTWMPNSLARFLRQLWRVYRGKPIDIS